jgi:biotin carboxylase
MRLEDILDERIAVLEAKIQSNKVMLEKAIKEPRSIEMELYANGFRTNIAGYEKELRRYRRLHALRKNKPEIEELINVILEEIDKVNKRLDDAKIDI